MSRLHADYLIETSMRPEDAAAVMAGEQSTGTFVALAAESGDFLDAHAARIESIETVGEASEPSLPGAKAASAAGGRPVWHQARVTLSWPISNFGVCLPTVLATVAGNLFELKPFSGLRLLDIRFPAEFAKVYGGPRFGIEGTRRLAGVSDRPLIGTIIKPSVGLSPEATAEQVDSLCRGGIDFIKDDELQVDGPHCPFEARVTQVMAVVERHADRMGRKPMVAFNLTGDGDAMRRRHDHALAHGATCIMVSLNSVGLTGLIDLARHSQLPIHAHRNGWGYLSRAPLLGFDYLAWSKLWRLAGADHMHVNGLRNKFCEPDESVIASARACLTPMFAPPEPDCRAVPVFSSGQTAAQVWDTHAALGSADLIYCAGGGITAHPGGIEAGVSAMRAAWGAACAGIGPQHAARSEPALATAFEFFGAAP